MNKPSTYSQTLSYNLQNACGLIEIPFKGRQLKLSQQDIATLLSGLSNAWTVLYRVRLFDLWDTCV
ncbi:hypothetical protein IC229_14045 [Spirosoma sp. BT702]|uniref:Uncharacterized protein n=1 Tax=Spirosoma profusum TaxID=2771354 RepID=A0A926XW44_9BACT|nr:hypothetical protein [Spirosoma profusum]MBD2701768.1 hypothetical protein [Spirosoma profusum]